MKGNPNIKFMIEAKQISKSFGNRKVLKNLNLSLQPGEIVALVGLNGIGKTTLIRTLCGLYAPDSGTIEIDGVLFTEETPLIREKLGVVLHATMLYANLTCLENLEFYSSLYGINSNDQRILDLLSMFGLKSRTNDKVRTLSRGLQQRLSIARALVHAPQYLLMDEVFSGLDQQSFSEFASILRQQSISGSGILFSTHEIDKVFSIATRIDIQHNGSIIFSASVKDMTPQSLLEKYSEVTGGFSFPNQELRGKL